MPATVRKPRANPKPAQYILFGALEFFGLGLILWDGLPIYRHLFVLERVATANDAIILWIAVVAIQLSYWSTLRHPPPFGFPEWPLLGHVVLFLGRLSFVFASSLFALVVYRNPDVFEFRWDRVLLFAAILFSVFCTTRHIEALGNLLLKGSARPGPN